MSQTQEPGTKIGKWFSIAAWLIVLIFLTTFFNRYIEDRRHPNQNITATDGENGVREIVLERNQAGHYLATGKINGEVVEFLLDTGASNVSIPAHLAANLGLKANRAIVFQTANGAVQGYTTVIKRLSLGGIELANIQGGINPGMQSDIILLGMSFLKQLEFTQKGNTLTIRQYQR